MNPDLRAQLEALHATLRSVHSIDPESRDLLIGLLTEITRLLGKTDQNTGVHPLTEPLEALAVRFEADHPALGNALRQVVDALGKAGI